MSPAAVEVRIPRLAESISEGTLAEWLKPDGAVVRMDEPIATLETDKAAVEIAAPESGVLRHARKAGETVQVNDVIARIEPGAAEAAPAAGAAAGKPASAGASTGSRPSTPATVGASALAPRTQGAPATSPAKAEPSVPPGEEPSLSPAVRRLLEEHRLSPSEVEATGKGGRLLKEDVLRHVESRPSDANGPGAAAPAGTPSAVRNDAASPPAPSTPPTALGPSRGSPPASRPRPAGGGERAVPMSRIRQRIAERLVQAQHTAAILTTFNEIDMTAVMDARSRWKEAFEKRHGVKLGFMSFFAHACILALGEVPELNAEVRGTDIVYKDFVHLGVAVGTERGLIVPVVKDAHLMSFADLEREIARLAERARSHTLALDELAGGTFTISNGGVYGSLMSTPILNPPQSGILGMHKIEKRPIAVNDQVVIRPMMYVALSYDHRIVDGEQAVTFQVRVKERLEDPERMLLEV